MLFYEMYKVNYLRNKACDVRVTWVGIAPSVYRLATGWTVRGSNTGGARFSAPVLTGPGAHPAFCTRGTGSFPGVKRPGRVVDHPFPSSAEVKESIELYLCSPSGLSCRVLWRTLPSLHVTLWHVSVTGLVHKHGRILLPPLLSVLVIVFVATGRSRSIVDIHISLSTV